ncbi:MAG: single-stranded-DNA-specific exonuclease RecJ [Candidatus Aminicenantales bacterium]
MSSELGIPLSIANILVNRKIQTAEAAHQFLFGTLEGLHDPYLMKGMKEAVERILKAVSQKEKILIFGDYDVDGVLSVVMLVKALESLGADADYFIPERLKEGYGLKEEHIEIVLKKKARLVISVDCGIKASRFVQKANSHGIDVIITDHHLPEICLPEALAILNPVLEDSGYPDKSLAGVGVVFKLTQALLERNQRNSSLQEYLKLVSIGTISDVAELRGENRLLVKFGLKELENISNTGLRSLIEVCGLGGKKISEGDVGFRIGPRINAAGRMEKADLAVRLFFSSSPDETEELARHLDRLNTHRQKTEEKIFRQAHQRIQKGTLEKSHKILIMGCEEWHRGVIGIVASRLKDYYSRPVIMFSYKDGKAYGSGRSIRDFSLIDCLEECKNLFLSYGGHPLAVGCSLMRENMDALKQVLNDLALSRITDEQMRKKVYIDATLDFDAINRFLLDHFFLLFPFGIGNPKPVFMTRNVKVVSQPHLLKGKHTKLLLRQGGRTFEALGWDREDWAQTLHRGDSVDAAYSFQFSSYLGQERLSFSLADLRRPV